MHDSLTEVALPPGALLADVAAHVGGAGGTVIVTVAGCEAPPASVARYVNESPPVKPGCDT